MRVALTNFTAGEMAPTLSARYDLARYRNAAQCMENFVPNLHGAAERRMGTIYLDDLGEPCVLIPFSFSAEPGQNFILVFSEKRFRVANAAGLLVFSQATPYALADLLHLSYAQVGDVVYLAHNNYPLHKVLRQGAAPYYSWGITPVTLNSSLRAPYAPKVTFNGKVDEPAEGETSYTLRYKIVAVDEHGKESLASPAGATTKGKHPSDWIQGNSVKVEWQSVPGAVEYNVYREDAGYFGFIGVANGGGINSGAIGGIQVDSMTGRLVHFSGSSTREIIIPGKQWSVQASDTRSNIDVVANNTQRAFIFDNKMLVFITETINTTTYPYEHMVQGLPPPWTPVVTTTIDKFWGMLELPNVQAPAGSYATHIPGVLGDDPMAPSGYVSTYTIVPTYVQSTSLSFIDNNYQADTSDTPREDWNPFTAGNNPGVVAFHQQRMVLAATPKTPQAFYMSRVGDFENFRKSRPLQEDDPVEYLIASGSIDAITWAASFGDLLLGTSGSEYKASGGDGSITTKNISITAQSYWGSADLLPIIIGNSILHVQRHGSRVRDLFYSLEKDGYAGNDLSIMAPHLFDGHQLKQWAYQQVPGSHIWIVREDGVLLALTYMKEHDIWGWSRHITDGKVRSVTTISGDDGDVLLLVVERKVGGVTKFFLERMYPRWDETEGVKEAFYVDCGRSYYGTPANHISGLGHLEGCAVAVLADGSPVEGCVVQNGAITLPYFASIVHVGLPFTSAISPMPVEGDTQTGTSLGRKRAYGQCTVRLHASVGGKYGASREDLFDFPFVPALWGEACELFSGDMDFITNGGQDTQAGLWLVQDRPMPFSVTGLALVVDMGQK